MSPRELKCLHLEPTAQVIIFDSTGKIIDTCNTLVKIESLDVSLFDYYPALQSMRQIIVEQQAENAPIQLPKVDFSYYGRTGIYDMEIYAHPEIEEWFVWIVIDKTEVYNELLKMQQERNELRLWKEQLESGRFRNSG